MSAEGGENRRYRPKKKALVGMGLLVFVISCLLAATVAYFQAQYAVQNILTQQSETQRAWLDHSLDSIRVWHNELMDQARYISSSEMFRLFVMDGCTLPREDIERLADPDSLHSEDDVFRSMAEQCAYIQDLLTDFSKRRAWIDVRILSRDGIQLVAPEFSALMTKEQKSLALKAVKENKTLFGPIRQSGNQLVMDMADPLLDVLGSADPAPVAVLLLTVPMDRPLMTFLARNSERSETILPRIVFADEDQMFMALIHNDKAAIEPVATRLGSLANISFGEREALDGKSRVYSMSGSPTSPNWLFVVETPAIEVEALIDSRTFQLYMIAGLVAVGITLCFAWFWAGYTGRQHEREAIRYEKLYNTIRNQKMMLDGINASFKAGMILVDQYGRLQMSNPSFQEICASRAAPEPGTPLVGVLPPKEALNLQQDMSRVNAAGLSACVEMTLPRRMEADKPPVDRLFRITLYPYSGENEDGKEEKGAGCVAIFQDITEFRARAQKEKEKEARERQKQAELISAFVRAIESVDPNLVGHSDKMAGVAALLAGEIQLDEKERETLDLAAKLSQVGKIFVPRNLLTKEGKLTPEELQEVRKAPRYADEILRGMAFDLPVRETVNLIGERVDGSGKPLGLTGAEISLTGRTLAVVNAFIAMTSSRSWRKGMDMSIDEAIAQLRQDSGYDQKIVEALARLPREAIAKLISKPQGGKA